MPELIAFKMVQNVFDAIWFELHSLWSLRKEKLTAFIAKKYLDYDSWFLFFP